MAAEDEGMKLLVLSDLHLEFSQFAVPDVDYDVVVLAGDVAARAAKVPFWACRSTNFGESTPIVFVAGNHEFYGRVMSSVLTEMRQLSTGTNFHALDCSETVLHGVRFLGCTLWTDFALHIDTTEGPKSDVGRSSREAGSALADFRVINVEASAEAGAPDGRARAGRRVFTPEDSIQLHFQHRAWLLQKLEEPFDGPTVVVTHHSPHRRSLASQYASDWVSGAFVNELPPCFFDVPVLWIHGHTHSSFDYQVGSCRVVCNPRGYVLAGRHKAPENKSFDPAFVVEVRTEKR